MSKQIQWFPGHMSKTLKEFKEIKTDFLFILLDSRAPESSYIDSFNEILENKKVIIVFTKVDLINFEDLKKWIKIYKSKFNYVISISLKNKSKIKNEILNILQKEKTKSLLPKIMIVGAPNVGKSTLINILLNNKSASVQNKPGLTKNTQWYQFNNKYWILDTPGVLQPKFISEKQGIILSAIGSIKLDILPLREVSIGLIKRIKELKIIDFDSSELYIDKMIETSKKNDNEIYKKIIRDYQDLKFGKILLD